MGGMVEENDSEAQEFSTCWDAVMEWNRFQAKRAVSNYKKA